jgi:riboflavin kinase
LQKHQHELLLFLASKAGLSGKAKTSTSRIASAMGISQQTASRKLRSLKKQGLINLNASPNGCTVSLTGQGVDSLKQQHLALHNLFHGRSKKGLKGRIKNGVGEGRYYVSRPPYLKQFRKLLGFKPFFGTLNLVVSQPELNSFLSGQSPLRIEGFKTEERSFGKIKAFPVLFQGKEKAAILIPERTVHPSNEIEIIAASNLRKKFRLKEGSKAELKLL